MYNSVDLLDLVKTRYSLPSDNQAALKIGVTRQSISLIRAKSRCFDVAQCLIIAELLSLDPLRVICSVQAEIAIRTKDQYKQNVFLKYAS